MRSDIFKSVLILLIITIISCAKRGTIDGGLKDTIAPVLKFSFPPNGATNFKGKEIQLSFDEYVKLKDINKQLIISPPMKQMPEILPSTASKIINIKIKDSLLPNTTYSFNFGQSIEDYNEGNPYKQFKYIFSTGTYIDSLQLSGMIKDAYNKTVDNFVTVMLYEVDAKFNDSVVYKQNPRFVTNTLDSLKTFRIENIKAGKYLLVALKDLNNNYKFDSKFEKIGFQKQFITIPNDTIFELELFKESIAAKVLNPKQASGNRIILPYQGKMNPAVLSQKIVLKNKNEVLQTVVTKFAEKDSMQIWYKSIKTDSLQVIVDKESFVIKVKNQKKDSLSFSPSHAAILNFRDTFSINCSQPISKLDAAKILILNKDSVAVAFTSNYDELNQKINLDFKKEPLENYKIKIQKDAIVSFYDALNKDILYKISTKNSTDYGNLRLGLKNIKSYPVIIELTNDKGKTIYSAIVEKEGLLNFDLIEPAKYSLRLIYDSNKNGIWDTGNYLQKLQAEEVIYYPKPIDVRANWDVEQDWKL